MIIKIINIKRYKLKIKFKTFSMKINKIIIFYINKIKNKIYKKQNNINKKLNNQNHNKSKSKIYNQI